MLPAPVGDDEEAGDVPGVVHLGGTEEGVEGLPFHRGDPHSSVLIHKEVPWAHGMWVKGLHPPAEGKRNTGSLLERAKNGLRGHLLEALVNGNPHSGCQAQLRSSLPACPLIPVRCWGCRALGGPERLSPCL